MWSSIANCCQIFSCFVCLFVSFFLSFLSLLLPKSCTSMSTMYSTKVTTSMCAQCTMREGSMSVFVKVTKWAPQWGSLEFLVFNCLVVISCIISRRMKWTCLPTSFFTASLFHQNAVCIYHLAHAYYMSRPSHSPWLYYTDYASEDDVMKLVVTPFYLWSCYFILSCDWFIWQTCQ